MKIKKDDLEKIQLYKEYESDPIRFIEENCMLPSVGGDKLIKLFEVQKKVLRSFFENKHLILLKSRQTGFSTTFQCLVVYLTIFHDNFLVGVLSRNGTEASSFCKKTEDLIEKIPNKWLIPGFKVKSAQSYVFENGSSLFSSTISPSHPEAAFRGNSLSLLIMDELAHTKYADEAWTGIVPTLSSAQLEAKNNGLPYGTLLLSTPNKTKGVGEFYFQMWTSSLAGETQFKPHRIHWSEIPKFRDDPNWYGEQCKLLNNDEKKIAQELDLKFVSTSDSLFTSEVQERLQNNIIEPFNKQRYPDGSRLDQYAAGLNKQKFYLIGVDIASSAGSDFSTIEVFDYETFEQVLEFEGKLEPKLFADYVKKIAQLLPHNLIIVENTGGFGLTILNELQHDQTNSYNIFGEWKGTNNDNFILGLNTNVRTRPLMISSLHKYVTDCPKCVKSERLALQLVSLTGKTGKIEADTGYHDDLVMAFAMCCYVRDYHTVDIENNYKQNITDSIENSLMSDIIAWNDDDKITLGFDDTKTLNQKLLNKINSNSLTGYVDVFSLIDRDYNKTGD